MNRYEAEAHCERLGEIANSYIDRNYPGYVNIPWVGTQPLTKAVKRKTGGNQGLVGRRARALRRHTLPRIGECGRRSK